MERPQLTETEQIWFDKVKDYIDKSNLELLKRFTNMKPYDYVCSWWLRQVENENGNCITTQKINYILTKIVIKGYLRKETNKSHTKFYLQKEEI